MARAKRNLILGALSGKIGNMVFRQVGKNTVVQAVPVVTADPSPGQLASRQAFQEAQDYASNILHDPIIWAIYTAIAKKRGGTNNARAMAISDYRKPPVLHEISLVKDNRTGLPVLLIRAPDTILVHRVEVKLLNPDGNIYNTGTAIQKANSDKWFYPAPDNGFMGIAEVTVYDLAGNTTSGKFAL